MAFDTQIEALAGTATQTEMDQWATDGVREIINILPPELKMECSTITSLTSSTPMDLDAEGEVFHVTRENADSGYFIGCRKVHPIFASSADDSTSLHYVTATDPIYWIESDTGGDPKLFVKPTPTPNQPARLHHVAFPTVDVSAVSAIVNFPNEAEYLVVLYAAIKVLQNKMNEKTGDLPNLSLPPAPIAPTLSDNSVSFSTSVPTYNTQTVAPDFADADNWLNTEEDSELVTSRTQIISAQLQQYQLDIQNELQKFNKENTEYQAQLQKGIKDAELSSADDSQKIQKYSSELQSYQAEVGAKVQDFQKVLEKHSINYQWYQSQYAQLKQDYNQGLSMLVGASLPQPPKKQEGER